MAYLIGFSAFKKFYFSEKPLIDSFYSGRRPLEGFSEGFSG